MRKHVANAVALAAMSAFLLTPSAEGLLFKNFGRTIAKLKEINKHSKLKNPFGRGALREALKKVRGQGHVGSPPMIRPELIDRFLKKLGLGDKNVKKSPAFHKKLSLREKLRKAGRRALNWKNARKVIGKLTGGKAVFPRVGDRSAWRGFGPLPRGTARRVGGIVPKLRARRRSARRPPRRKASKQRVRKSRGTFLERFRARTRGTAR